MGTDTDIPSGILCKAMAMVRDKPKLILLVVDINVAIPSRMLCNIITSIDIIPTLYRELFSLTVKNKSAILDMVIPNTIKMNTNEIIVSVL